MQFAVLCQGWVAEVRGWGWWATEADASDGIAATEWSISHWSDGRSVREMCSQWIRTASLCWAAAEAEPRLTDEVALSTAVSSYLFVWLSNCFRVFVNQIKFDFKKVKWKKRKRSYSEKSQQRKNMYLGNIYHRTTLSRTIYDQVPITSCSQPRMTVYHTYAL